MMHERKTILEEIQSPPRAGKIGQVYTSPMSFVSTQKKKKKAKVKNNKPTTIGKSCVRLEMDAKA